MCKYRGGSRNGILRKIGKISLIRGGTSSGYIQIKNNSISHRENSQRSVAKPTFDNVYNIQRNHIKSEIVNNVMFPSQRSYTQINARRLDRSIRFVLNYFGTRIHVTVRFSVFKRRFDDPETPTKLIKNL